MNLKDAQDALDRQVGMLLIACAVECQTDLKRNLNRQYPPASREEEFPARRTGNLQRNVGYEPTDPLAVGRLGRIKFGFGAAAFYGAILELFRNRLGLRETVNRLGKKIDSILDRIKKL